jgi:pimeloyl-ACP methyl ester carboxylesterase
MAYLEHKDARIYYEIHGAGEPLLYLHGWHGTSASFKHNLLDLLKERYQVIIMDLPGYGNSEFTEPSFDRLSEIITDLLKQAGVSRVSLVGFCMGSVIALDYAIRNPRIVRNLMLIETYLRFPPIIFPLLIKGINLPLFKFFLHHKTGLALMRKYLLLKDGNYRKDFVSALQGMDLSVSIKYVKMLWTYSRQNHDFRIKGLGVPTTMVVGEHTHRAIARDNRTIRSFIRNSRIVPIEGCRHFPLEENGIRLSKIIQENVCH